MAARHLAVLVVAMLHAGAVLAASEVVHIKGDGQDQILTVTDDGGSADTSITFICEYPKLEYGIVIQAPADATGGRRLRLRADGRAVAARSQATAAGAVIFALKGKSGQDVITRLTASRVVDTEGGTRSMRFVLANGAGHVARFRQLCGL